MTAKIDIKTPAGKSLEGFPKNQSIVQIELDIRNSNVACIWVNDMFKKLQLNKGDTITIEVL